jgi:2-polyprenyl-3-methyl-5-hydroxy-6-metoxy-1,4-benzoquinol methylase
MPDLSVRSNLPEKMDDPAAPEKELRQNLRELETINKLLGGYQVVLNALGLLTWPDKPVHIVDYGCGGGDMLRKIGAWAKLHRKQVRLSGIDLNPVMIRYAMETSGTSDNIKYYLGDVMADTAVNHPADIIICSLFCHHMSDEQLIKLLPHMRQTATKTVIINDLHRHWFAYYAISILTFFFSKTYMVKHDARLSVARSFKRNDWKHILRLAGIEQYTLKWRWAFRWELIIPCSTNSFQNDDR